MITQLYKWKLKRKIHKYLNKTIEQKTIAEPITPELQKLKLQTIKALYEANPLLELYNDDNTPMTIEQMKTLPYHEFRQLLEDILQEMQEYDLKWLKQHSGKKPTQNK